MKALVTIKAGVEIVAYHILCEEDNWVSKSSGMPIFRSMKWKLSELSEPESIFFGVHFSCSEYQHMKEDLH